MNMIQLREGPLVREDALLLALRLEHDGHEMRVGADGKLRVTNAAALSEETRAQIGALRFHLMALIAYDPPEPR